MIMVSNNTVRVQNSFFLAQVLDYFLAFFLGTICLVFATVWN